MKKAAIIAAPLAVAVFSPLMMIMAVAGVGGSTQAATCTTTSTMGSRAGAFGLGTLNWRGASHYRRNPHPGEQPYSVRVPHMVDKVDASGASIIGFQEFEPPQAHAFLQATHGHWAIVAGRAHGHSDSRDAIAYQPGRWQVDRVRYLTIRYGGPRVAIPLVRFASTTGLGAIWALNTHNPANVVNGSNAMRDAAVRAEAHALHALQTAEPGTPLFLTGDMNDRARFKRLFLSLADQGWSTANPTSRQVDWIMGGPGVKFTSTVVDQSTNDDARHYTDHPFVHTTAQLAPTGHRHSTVGTTGSSTGTSASAVVPPGGTAPTLEPDASGNVHLGQWTLDADQLHNAQTMVSMASARGGASAALVIISAALTESGLSTDPGSSQGAFGVLQQTPSADWGTQAQVMSTTHAANAFLDHLDGVSHWRSMQPWEAAQAVQHSGAGDPSSAYYQRHHLRWGYGGNYRQKLAEARAIVAAFGGGVVPAAATCTTDPAARPYGVQGHGPFTPNTQIAYVGPYDPATLMSRMQQIMGRNNSRGNLDPFFGSEPDGTWYHDCQHFVANLDGRSSSGYASAQSAWRHFLATGAAHPANSADGMSPPIGAWLYFAPDHVVVYLGNNLVAGTDTWGTGSAKTGPVSDITNGRWHLPYLGWVAPWGDSQDSADRRVSTSGIARAFSE